MTVTALTAFCVTRIAVGLEQTRGPRPCEEARALIVFPVTSHRVTTAWGPTSPLRGASCKSESANFSELYARQKQAGRRFGDI
jgi:hypothetical protein